MCSSNTEIQVTWTTEDDIEIQAVDANGRVVFDSKINVFLDTEAEVSSVTEVVLPQFIFPDFQASLKDFLSLGSTNSAVDSNLFITTDAKRTNGVTRFGEDRLLTSELFQHLHQHSRYDLCRSAIL